MYCERGLFIAPELADILDEERIAGAGIGLSAGRLGPALAMSKLAIAFGASRHHG